ncbi:MAG: sialate O-acetylesterase [Kiritimatiellia bacterium]|jgi:sialate O-acetylesterase
MNAQNLRLALATVLISYAFATTSLASLELPWLFADHMVIQRNVPVPVWGTGTPGSTITVTFGGQDHLTAVDAAGEWMVTLKAMAANAQGRALRVASSSENASRTIQDILVGEVWLCAGQSNMWYPLKSCTGGKDAATAAGNSAIRLLNRRGNAYPAGGTWKPATLEKCTAGKYYSGTWAIDAPESAAQFSGVAYWFGKKLHAELNVPIGLINVAVGGTTTEAYTSREGLLSHPRLRPIVESDGYWFDNETVSAWPRKRAKENLSGWLKHKTEPMPRHPFEPTFLFECGIAPLVPMAFRGVIWYQGESNATDADNKIPIPKALVRAGIETMISDWRAQWKRDFPFLYVQLPGMGRPWELFREVQLECLDIANTGMAISIDVGDPNDVHPKNKQPVGERLARWALGTTYGKELVYSGPLYQVSRDRGQESGGRLRLTFEHTGTGLSTSDGKAVRGLEVAGTNGVYHPAEATIDGHAVLVRSTKVAKPVAARYAWAPFPDGNLVNSANLPASPFRTATSSHTQGQTLSTRHQSD